MTDNITPEVSRVYMVRAIVEIEGGQWVRTEDAIGDAALQKQILKSPELTGKERKNLRLYFKEAA